MNVVGVILAAGFGMRLRPSTERCPKPLIPVGGIEPLFFALQRFHELGIRRVVVNAHHLKEQIEDSLKKWESIFTGMSLRVSFEAKEILGTGGALLKIIQDHRDWFGSGDTGLLLQNGDTLAQFDFQSLLKDPAQSTLAVSFLKTHLEKYNPLWLHPVTRDWLGIGKTPPDAAAMPAHFLGIHYLSPSAVKALSQVANFPIESTDLFNGIYRPLANQGFCFHAHECIREGDADAFWFDMTTPEFLLEAQRYVLESYKRSSYWGDLLKKRYPGIEEVEPGVWVSQGHFRVGCRYLAPAVWVEKEIVPANTKPMRERGPLVLGPHASLISEGNPFTSKTSLGEVRIRNAVVFFNSPSGDFVPETLSDALCVV